MSDKLHKLLFVSSHEIVQSILEQLQGSLTPHYEQMDLDQLTGRVVLLVGTFMESIKKDAIPFVTYIQQIAEERISEGIFLKEVQLALTILEEQVWQLVTAQAPRDDQVAHLRRVSYTIGAAKDQLAQIYLRRTEQAERRASSLESRLEALFTGTDSPPVHEEPDGKC